MAELSAIDPIVQPQSRTPSRGTGAVVSRNIVASLVRAAVYALVALVLPAFLTHRLPVTTYGAWVLILQLGAYVSFLDFGVQTGIAKFVAEYEARGDDLGASRRASAGFAIMVFAGVAGVAMTLLLAWQVPRLFHAMPASLYRDVRTSVLLIGASLSFQLACSVFSAIFLGLQRYTVPMAISIASRVLETLVICLTVFLHGSLVAMGTAVALVNVATAFMQIMAWHRLASRIRVSLSLVGRRVLGQMAHYCSLLAIWEVGMVCVSGLDLAIVGHYDYEQTAYYSVATLPTGFVLLVISSMLGPLMPASSALSTLRTPSQMGDVLARATRYSTMLLLLTGLPLMIWGFPILRLWVGPLYALHSLQYLRILVLANVVRNICLPYATMVVATGKQGAATATAISEALVNLGSSIYLASRFGAIGVAIGTLLGAFVSVSLHFSISMHFTHQTLSISRARLFLKGVLRPATIAIPSLFFIPLWWSSSRNAPSVPVAFAWGLATLFFAWFGNLNIEERNVLARISKRLLMLPLSPG